MRDGWNDGSSSERTMALPQFAASTRFDGGRQQRPRVRLRITTVRVRSTDRRHERGCAAAVASPARSPR
eukprot:2978214-Prymnesium_polylepis.1